ncbi:bifunctional adenosylcobinamide kinase/adenosylcobinamide-phosphate guanylyltransferase [Marinobacterium arenosum]|uniref:bifunctional adenosylcobinamide kinase/adenosylcobinamide-phosphate guanylyltransferase n=1 Tax=Marinobacterium arenosum TaxID=2862496 RepID=UPI001C94C386|nr:bifunctional adenosylcobinamide kinase/adenosylcobinamide-phosphate guanylyltransferase [Marinobacterium arenosum]MBY4676047.1 bifunctional adenosylcobinamide kinase/adenosylcobinamide-phosphate guanylyltransferase [Marinobacterium arenosum]
MKHLILGGARSGKSRFAEQQAQASGLPVTYIATAQAWDDEMAARIRRHRDDRPDHWRTVEAPLNLADTLQHEARSGQLLLVDCLTLWLTNLLCAENEAQFASERQALLDCLAQLPGQLLLVSNEVGQGIVPDNALARRFVDEAGFLHQALAARCERVSFVTAGIPNVLKDNSIPQTAAAGVSR